MTELPTTFGKYFLTEKLATGGMAEIYLAKLVGPGGFEKPLVIKQIHPKLSGQRHFVDLFVAEAKTLVTLAHGNIVPVYELGVIDDTYFIAMEYIDGPTLYRLTETLARRDARMEPALAAWITAKILEGLDYAHRKGEGVIHRDLSPRNVMLSRDGEVKLVDFGIAVTLGAVDAGPDEQSAPTGSFPYMSPEQVRREPLTGQTDLFSVGVLLWEMLVGSRLFARTDADATLAAVTESDIPRPSKQRAEIPAKLDEVVMRALERDKATRWSSAGDMLAALQRYLYGLEETPGPRDVAALVAKFCPPETRRLPTHAESTPVPPSDEPAAAPPAGPHTAVIPRDAGPARGKPRARTETFATNIDLQHIMSGTTPIAGMTALTADKGPSTVVTPRRPADGAVDDDPDHDPTPVPPPSPLAGDDDDDVLPATSAVEPASRPSTSPAASRRMRSIRPDSEPQASPGGSRRMRSVRPDSEPLTEAGEQPRLNLAERVPGRAPPNRSFLVLAAIGATLLLVGAIYVFMRGRGAVLRPDAAPTYDAPYYAFGPEGGTEPPPAEASVPVDAAVVADAAHVELLIDAAKVAPPIDAAKPPPPADARVAPPIDARVATPIDAAAPAGTGKLAVGANPWGDIYIDGTKRGRTPSTIDVPAGKHVVEVVFSGEDPPLKKTFTITVTPNETQTIHADFTKP
jgi:serine/threonine-protein kinase